MGMNCLGDDEGERERKGDWRGGGRMIERD